MSDWVKLARLVQTNNLHGGFVVRSTANLPLLLCEGMNLALVPPVIDAPRMVCVAELRWKNANEAVVFFEEISDASTAEMLLGSYCLARRDDVDLSFLDQTQEVNAWQNWRVFDVSRGFVGTLSHVEERPMQALLVIVREGHKDVLVPMVEEFIVRVDEEKQAIYMDLAPGLLDL